MARKVLAKETSVAIFSVLEWWFVGWVGCCLERVRIGSSNVWFECGMFDVVEFGEACRD